MVVAGGWHGEWDDVEKEREKGWERERKKEGWGMVDAEGWDEEWDGVEKQREKGWKREREREWKRERWVRHGGCGGMAWG